MKKEETKQFILWCVLGAIGCGFMAAGDWLLGCIPLQQTDTGLFNRAYYLSGAYGLWRPVLTVGLGAIGGFLYYFVVKALNADINEKYRKTKNIQFLCGIFTVAIALTIHNRWPPWHGLPPIWGRVSERRSARFRAVMWASLFRRNGILI